MQIKINIDEGTLTAAVTESIVASIMSERGYESREAKMGIRSGVDKAIKEYIYSNKDVIIERVVNRAVTEVVRKSIPELLKKISTE